MANGYSPLIGKGTFELYTGCMQSGKSRRLIERLDKLGYIPSCKIIAFKPQVDTRNEHIESRFGSLILQSVLINEERPEEILQHIDAETDIIAIDEINLFTKEIVQVIEQLLKEEKHIIAAGLDTDFRGEAFTTMAELLCIATHVEKLAGVCQYPNCANMATRTQRILEGKPAHYTTPLIMIEGNNAEYQCRCIKHHEVPGKPV